jgi:hypothetical protein
MTVKPLCDYSIHILHWRYDTWIKEGDLPSLNDEDVAWFRDEVGLSLDDLHRICAGAREIVRELKPSDELLHLTYEVGEAWYIDFVRVNDGIRLEVSIRRPRTPQAAE